MADKTMKILVIGGNSYEIVDEQARTDIETLKDANTIDATLSHSGQAADAKATGDAINQLSYKVNKIISVPTSTTEDNGKFLRVVNGSALWQTVQNAEEVSF